MEYLCSSFAFLIPHNMEPNQFEWTFQSPSLKFHLQVISVLLVKGWCLFAKNFHLHYTNQSYRCEDWIIKAEDRFIPSVILWVEINPLCLYVTMNCNFILFSNLSVSEIKLSAIMLSMIVPAQFPILQRSLLICSPINVWTLK